MAEEERERIHGIFPLGQVGQAMESSGRELSASLW